MTTLSLSLVIASVEHFRSVQAGAESIQQKNSAEVLWTAKNICARCAGS